MIKFFHRLLCLAFVGAIALTGCVGWHMDPDHQVHCGTLVDKWRSESAKYPIMHGLVICDDGQSRLLSLDSITFNNNEKGERTCGIY